jgi:hypothetical protein
LAARSQRGRKRLAFALAFAEVLDVKRDKRQYRSVTPDRRELERLKAHVQVLKSMYLEVVGVNEPTVRLLFLYASVLKLERMTRAVELLANDGFVEEVQCIGRTAAEITINAAYLQDAEDEEIDRFQHFDTQCAFKHATRLRPYASRTLNAEEQAQIESVVLKARSLTGRKDVDPSWSKRTLLQRAEFSDNKTKLNLMKLLALTSYAQGNSAVHATYDSLSAFVTAITEPETTELDRRREEMSVAIGSMNYALMTFSLYFNSLMWLKFEHDIIAAGKIGVDQS